MFNFPVSGPQTSNRRHLQKTKVSNPNAWVNLVGYNTHNVYDMSRNNLINSGKCQDNKAIQIL